MGLIEVSPTTSPQRAAAIRARLMNPPKRRAIPIHVASHPVQIQIQPKEREWLLQHDYHVNTRAIYLLSEMGGRVMAIPLIKRMCEAYGVSYHDICSDHRVRKICFPRQKMMWVVRQRTAFSFPEIGRKFGGRDHTTVLHAVNKIDALIASNDPSVTDLKGWFND